MKAIFDHREPVAHGMVTFWFRPEKPVRYTAGQFTELHLPHTSADKRGERRWFTLSSSPTEPLLAITTKFAAGAGSSFKQELLELQPGTPVTLADPLGDFVLPKDPTIPLLFVAAGAGITPVRSMVRYLHDTGERRDIRLLYAVHDAAELAFVDLFTTYGLALTPFVTRPRAKFTGTEGPLTTSHILDVLPDDRTLVYLSGPEQMVEKLFRELQASGIHEERLVVDYFHGYAPV